MRRVALLLLFASLPLMAAESSPPIPNYDSVHLPYRTKACEEKNTDREMKECSAKVLEVTKAQMEQRYKTVLGALEKESPKTAKSLKTEQQLWKKMYPISCSIKVYESEGGTGYYSILDFCLIKMVNERTSYLNSLTDS